MIGLVFKHEWRRLGRSPRLVTMLALACAVLVATTWWSASSDAQQLTYQQAAAQEARGQWLGQGAANPHGMAHFGDFVFRPNGPLARLDKGVQAQMGQVLRIEGHKRAMPLTSTASKAGPLARFGRFDPAFLLQAIVPLILVLVGAGLVIEGKSTRQQWMLAHGVSGNAFLWGKTAFLASIGIALLMLVLTTTVAVSPIEMAEGDSQRLAGSFAIYSVFLFVCAALIMAISTLAKSATSAILILIGAWLVGTTILPHATGSLVSSLAPLPSRDLFEATMREARSAEIDAHNPADKRLAQIEADLMADYGVSTKEELPVNFDGIAMQIDEEIGNAIWDQHFSGLEAQMQKQGFIASLVSFINPFQAIRNTSMTFAGTDLAHDIAFQDAAEEYRRSFVKKLNDEHAYGGSTTGDWSFETDASFFAGIEPFDYPRASLGDLIGTRAIELSSLLLWTLLGLIGVSLAARRMEKETDA